MKKEKTKLMIWAVVALVFGFIIGMVLTNVTIGSAITIKNSSYENLRYEDVFTTDFKIKEAIPVTIANKLIIEKFGTKNVLSTANDSPTLCGLPDGSSDCTCGGNGFSCPCHNGCMIGGTYVDEDGVEWVVPGTVFTTCADWSSGFPTFPTETNK
jgi:hypothetical protein